VGIVYGYALDAGDIKGNEKVMRKAYELGRKPASEEEKR